jgi:serine/threonine-protein kinase
MATGQNSNAIVDFQTVLNMEHRGAAVASGSNVYPMAQMGLARAYRANGDKGNSAASYKEFGRLWKNGDAGHPLMVESRGRD